MMTHEERVALWHRLRRDPDFQPEWLNFMKHRPPTAPDTEYREWADGGTNQREHLIADISFRGGWLVCTCGARIEAARTHALEDAWDLHRGLTPEKVAERRLAAFDADHATDEEVSDFLFAIDNEGGDL